MGPVARLVGLHFGAAVPNFVILQEASGTLPWYDNVLASRIMRIDGYWQIPDRPGFGVEINETEARKHPFEQEKFEGLEAIVARDGTMADW